MKYLFITFAVLVFAASLLAQTELTRTGETEIPLNGEQIWVKHMSGYDFGYINAGNNGIRLVNLSTYSIVAQFMDAPVRDIWVRGDYVYVAAYTDTFYILEADDLDRVSSTYLGNVNYRGTAICVSETTGTGYATTLWAYIGIYTDDNHCHLQRINVNSPTSPGFPIGLSRNVTDLGEGYIYDLYPIWGGNNIGTYTNGWNYLCVLRNCGTGYSLELRSPGTYFYYPRYYAEGYPGSVLEDSQPIFQHPYSLWVYSHPDQLYAYVAEGEGGISILELNPNRESGYDDDIDDDPPVVGWKADPTDTDYRDFKPFGDIGAIANYTDTGKMLYIVDLSNMEYGIVDTTASIDGLFGTGCWLDATRVHVVADSLDE